VLRPAGAGRRRDAHRPPDRRVPRRWRPTSPRPGPSTSTAPPSWTARWCRHGPGPTTRPGCASSSRSCGPRRPR